MTAPERRRKWSTMPGMAPPETLEIELASLEGHGAPLSARLVRRPAGATCAIGTDRQCEIRLPRPPFQTVGQKACRISWLDQQIVLEPLGGPASPVLLDGQPATGGALETGDHRLELSGHAFRLTLRLSGA